jgi:hypothetical protein
MNRRRAGHVWSVALLAVGLALFSGGCLDRDLKPLNPCLVSGVAVNIAVTNIDKVDLLFMVDNSGSMREEQSALRAQFQSMVTVLTTGDRDNDGMQDFPPATDLHLAVVSSDMGLVGITGIPNCDGLGDDGVMQNKGNTALTGCQASYPPFLAYVEGQTMPATVANDLGCIASLGTEGCGFEQQLESTLKALWPAVDRGGNGAMDPNGTVRMPPDTFVFLGDPATGFGTTGHGDGMNAGFLRNDPTVGLSLIAVILVTDEEDCSSFDTRHFTPPQLLDPADKLASQDLNLRCFFNPQNLYDVQRYVDGLQALRPDAPQLVIFGGIVGVPPDLVSKEARMDVNFDDEVQRESFYQKILGDLRMQEVPDPTRTPEQGGNLTPSCSVDNDGDGVVDSRAFPPRRMVEVARRFGANGVIQSICQADFTDAMDAIIEVIAKQLGAVCLPRELVPDSEGMVGCDVVWELPKQGTAPPTSPTACSQKPYLEFVETDKTGREVCRVKQLPVTDGMVPPSTAGEGWYYDNFSEEVIQSCPPTTPQRVAFSAGAKPPTGVNVKLECLNETQSLVNTRTDIAIGPNVYQPTIGSPCKEVEFPRGSGNIIPADAVCATTLQNGMRENLMICHAEANVCVRPCVANSDCPASWVCDDRPETVTASGGSPFCVNPTCGDSSD